MSSYLRPGSAGVFAGSINGCRPEAGAPRTRFLRPSNSGIVFLSLALASAFAFPVNAAEIGEEVEISSGVVTSLSCALKVKKSGKLEALTACPLSETSSGLVVFDVAEREIYRIAAKKVGLYELEEAYGGGNIDLSGVVVEASNGIAVVEVKEYAITRRPKPGAFKGCL